MISDQPLPRQKVTNEVLYVNSKHILYCTVHRTAMPRQLVFFRKSCIYEGRSRLVIFHPKLSPLSVKFFVDQIVKIDLFREVGGREKAAGWAVRGGMTQHYSTVHRIERVKGYTTKRPVLLSST